MSCLEIKNRDILEIKDIGKFHELDSHGYIQNSAIYPLVQKEYTPIINEVVKKVIEKFDSTVHSIYLRGSVAKGIAIHGVSDIDLFFLSYRPFEESEIQYMNDIAVALCKQFSFVNGIEMYTQTMSSLENTSTKFMLKTQCVCIYGEDVIPSLPSFKIDKNAINHVCSLEKDVELTLDGKHSYAWMMKRIVRMGLEICMERAQKYTRDLYLCYQVFADFYPDKEASMGNALRIAIGHKPEDIDKAALLKELTQFLMDERNKNLN